MKQTDAPQAPTAQTHGFAPWQWLKGKRISYFTLPLLIMATLMEFVILATGWRYQQLVCLPNGMGVTFFGIGPIGATILAVELLKLPLAVWTASRRGWQKGFMLLVGLPLICLLTFQLVKDMAVYEMGVALTPAGKMLEQASVDENKIVQLNDQLAAIEQKKIDAEQQRTDFAARQAKAKADLEESLRHQSETRKDAISLTDYQQKELAEVESRQAAIIKQFDADTAQLTQALATLRAQREVEVARASKWNAEEARIENQYKAKLADYTNRKATYLKDKARYDQAHPVKRLVMAEPIDPGVPPVRETNTVLKPVEIAEIDAQIKTKEAELVAVNNQRRDRVAQVEADARRVRADFEERSKTKRGETDRRREELLVAAAALTAQWAAEQKQIDQDVAAAAQKVDGIHAELAAARGRADALYEARERSIKDTQVHRIATTVEIVRGLLFGQRPISITATAKERGDLYTDQISMVRVWVYPVLAFIVAFLPTLLVEVAFSTVFQSEEQRPPHRLGFFGRRLHWVYTRAGRQKILRAERLAQEARRQIAARDAAVAAAQAAAAETGAAKDAEVQAARAAAATAAAAHQEQLRQTETAWVAKYTELAESLNRSVLEQDALRDLQKSEVERQVQLRQQAWADRITSLRQELDGQRAASEKERATLLQEQQQKLLALAEDCRTQVAQARRDVAAAELAAVDHAAGLTHDLQEALQARDAAEAELKRQAQALTAQVSQAREDTARECEKSARQEKHRLERQLAELEKTLRQQADQADRQLNQQEQELTAAFEARLHEERVRIEHVAQQREADREHQAEARGRELDARWQQERQQQEETAARRLEQLEQQWQARADARVADAQQQAEQELRRRETEFARQLDAQSRETALRGRQELQQQELAFHATLAQREQELTAAAAARETELQTQFAADRRVRQDEWERQAEARVRATATRLTRETQQQDELFQIKLRQREQQLAAQFDARQAELKARGEQDRRAHEQEWQRDAEVRARATEARWTAELQQKEESFQSQLRQRDEQWQAKLDATRFEWQAQAEQELRRREAEAAESRARVLREREVQLRKELQEKFEAAHAERQQRERDLMAQLAATTDARQTAEKERDEARQSASQVSRQLQDMKKKLIEASSVLADWQGANGQRAPGQMIVR